MNVDGWLLSLTLMARNAVCCAYIKKNTSGGVYPTDHLGDPPLRFVGTTAGGVTLGNACQTFDKRGLEQF